MADGSADGGTDGGTGGWTEGSAGGGTDEVGMEALTEGNQTK